MGKTYRYSPEEDWDPKERRIDRRDITAVNKAMARYLTHSLPPVVPVIEPSLIDPKWVLSRQVGDSSLDLLIREQRLDIIHGISEEMVEDQGNVF